MDVVASEGKIASSLAVGAHSLAVLRVLCDGKE